MDPIQIGLIESAITSNLANGKVVKFVEAVRPLGITDFTGANLFGDDTIDKLLTDAMTRIESGETYADACKDLMDYVQNTSTPVTVNASESINNLVNKVNELSDQVSKLTTNIELAKDNVASNFSVDGSSKEFQDGKELAKLEPGKSTEDLNKLCSEKGLEGQDAANFKFGYNCIDKKADNFSTINDIKVGKIYTFKEMVEDGEVLVGKVLAKKGSELSIEVIDTTDPTTKPGQIINFYPESTGMTIHEGRLYYSNMNHSEVTSTSDVRQITPPKLGQFIRKGGKLMRLLKLSGPDKIYLDEDGNRVVIHADDNLFYETTDEKFNEVIDMSMDDKIKEAVKGKVKGTYKWSKDGKTLAITGVTQDEFKEWKKLVGEVLGDEIAVIGANSDKDLPSDIQFCDDSVTFSKVTEYFSYEDDKVITDEELGDEVSKEVLKLNESEEYSMDEVSTAISRLTDIVEMQQKMIMELKQDIKKFSEGKMECSKVESTEDTSTVEEAIQNDKKVIDAEGKEENNGAEVITQDHSFSATDESSRYSSLKAYFNELD